MDIHSIEPKEIWNHFFAINAVPRASKKEEKIIAMMQSFGEKLQLPTTVDEVGNIIITKPASKGMEDRKKIILQSHLDMVCQKNNDVVFDFDQQGIEMLVDGGWLKAKGTTLGADNGLGVACMMAILESTTIVHPEIEALFTIDEETGMTGALGLKPKQLTGDILLNLDTEEDHVFSIGCAGGIDVSAYKTYPTEQGNVKSYQLIINGLQGGHSGMDIHKGFGNANVLLNRFLKIFLNYQLQLTSIDGGGLRNAIPREAKAIFTVDNDTELQTAFSSLKQDILQEFASIEQNLKIELHSIENTENALNQEDSSKIVCVISAIHNGVFRMSPDIENLVEASNNLARVELKNGELKILNLTRSSVESSKKQLLEQLSSVFALAEMRLEASGSYPGWKPNPQSSILTVMSDLYKEMYHTEPVVEACHAGLECGIIGAHYPNMEMISFGTTILGAHSPDERASISSTQKFWQFIQAILANIPKK